MKFLVIYQEMGLQGSVVEKEQQQIIEQLSPAFSKGLIEDVIFLNTYKKGRGHEIIDLTKCTTKHCCLEVIDDMERDLSQYIVNDST